MSTNADRVVIQNGTLLRGKIRNCTELLIAGRGEGDLVADDIVVFEGGELSGQVRAKTLTVYGKVEGDVIVSGLLRIEGNGSVVGMVQYGALAMESGGNLVADLKNVPPRLTGDFLLEVQRGGIGLISTQDLAAIDPDDADTDLVFFVSDPVRGHVAYVDAPDVGIVSFTQADIAAGRIVFVHDGSGGVRAGFDVVCQDGRGAVSGMTQTVRVNVID